MAEDDATAARAKDAANLDAAAKAALASLQGVSFSSKGEHSRAQPRPVPQAQVQQASEKQDRLFVSKVPQSLGQAELRAHFAQFGDLTDVYLPAPPGGGRGHKGICFVSFADASGIQKAIAHGAHEVQGSPISVDIAAPRAPPPSTVTASVQSGCRVFLTKVTADVTRADLQAHFCRFGELSDCYVPPGNKGIAFVSFKDPSTASSVVAHQQHEVKPGLVLIAAPAFDRPQQGSKGGGKGGFGGCGGGCNAFNGACGGCDLGSFAGFGGASCSGCGFSDFSMMQGFQNGFQAGANQQSFGAPAFAPQGGFVPQGMPGGFPVQDGMGQFQASQLQTQQGFGFANFGCPQMGQADYGAFQHPQAERPGPY